MIDFSVLGSLGLRSADGTELRAVLVRQKQVALLAYLALREPRGWHQRNPLLALFWPESDDRRARFSLRSALYELRGDLGPDAIRVRGDDEISIDPVVLHCDAVAFEEALDTGRLAEAMERYKGPLLDGVVVAGLQEFQQWLDARREGLRRRAAAAATTLSSDAELANDLLTALEWARRGVELAPYEEVALRRQLVLLDRMGDRVAAGRAFDQWAARLRADLDSEPSPDTVALIQRIRGAGAPAMVRPAEAEGRVMAPPGAPTPSRRSWAGWLALAGAVLALGASFVLWQRRVPPPNAVGTIVLPFAYEGSAETAYLGGAMASLMSATLGTSGPMAGVDPRAVAGVLAKHRAEGDVLRLGSAAGRALGARYFIAGSVVRAQRAMRVEASLYDVTAPGEPLARAASEGDADSVFAIADRVARDLLSARMGAVSTALLGTTSVPALRAYVDGERELLASRYDRAAAAFQRAVASDSTFARGWFRLGYALGWGAGSGRAIIATARAVSLEARMSAEDRLLLHAWQAFLVGDISGANRLYLQFLTHDDRHVEAWLQLGELRYHWGAMLGIPPRDAVTAFRRVLALAPDQGAALVHLVRLAARDVAGAPPFDSLVQAAQAVGLEPLETLELRALSAQRSGDTAAAERIVTDVAGNVDATRGLIRLLLTASGDAFLVQSLARGLTRQDNAARAYGWAELAHLAALQGRYRASEALLDTLARWDSSQSALLRAWLLLLPMRLVPRDEIVLARRAIAGVRAQGTDGERKLYLEGALALADGDPATAAGRATQLIRAAGPDGVEVAQAHAFGRLLRSEVLARAGNAQAGLEALGTPEIEPGNTFPDLMSILNARERYDRAALWSATGHNTEALTWLSTFSDPSSYDGWLLGAALAAAAPKREAGGDRAGARADYAKLIALWGDADPELQPLVAHARARLEALR